MIESYQPQKNEYQKNFDFFRARRIINLSNVYTTA